MTVELEGADPRLGYLVWGLRSAPSMRWVADYLSLVRDVDVRAVTESLGRIVEGELYPPRNLYEGPLREDIGPALRFQPPSTATPADYMAWVGRPPGTIQDFRGELGADNRGERYGLVEEAAYRLMLLAFVGTLDGRADAMSWLGVLMVRGNLNRQLTISYFLGVATDGVIGNLELAPPSADAVIGWAEASVTEPRAERVLPNMLREYVDRRRWG